VRDHPALGGVRRPLRKVPRIGGHGFAFLAGNLRLWSGHGKLADRENFSEHWANIFACAGYLAAQP
jgi:hypothetical protein